MHKMQKQEMEMGQVDPRRSRHQRGFRIARIKEKGGSWAVQNWSNSTLHVKREL